MKVTKEQLVLDVLDLDLNVAYFSINSEDELTFDTEFKYSTEKTDNELGYFNGTGQKEATEVTFIDVTYISLGYDVNDNPIYNLDIDKTDLEEIITDQLEYNLN